MIYKQDKINELHKNINKLQTEIKALIGVSKHDDACEKFKILVNVIGNLDKYNKSTWDIKQTQKWWLFFDFLGKYQFVTSYISIIETNLQNCDLSEVEALEFLRIELIWSATDDPILVKDKILNLLNIYPYNLEFSHTAAHVLARDKKTYFDAIKLYRKCINAWGTQHSSLISQLYNFEINIFRNTLEEGDYLHAEKQLDLIISYSFYKNNPMFNNASLIHRERLKDRKFTEATAKKIERELKRAVVAESEVQNKKNIEQLGVFSAIITFIITAAASAFSSEKSMTPLILIAIGLILILFITTISLLHFRPKSLLKDFRFYLLALFVFLTIYTVNTTKSLESKKQSLLEKMTTEIITTNTKDITHNKALSKSQKTNLKKKYVEELIPPTKNEFGEVNKELIEPLKASNIIR